MALPILNAMHFTALQSLRFLFLLLIFLSHYSFAGIPPLDAGGDCGVAFFFILSGFITAHSRGRQIEEGSYSHRKFLTIRFLKLYPLHLLCLGAALIIHWKNHNMDAALPLLTNLLLIQSYVPLPEYYFSGNGVSWFLSTLFLMYLLFPFLYRRMVLSPRRQMASWLMLWGLAYSTIWHFTPDNLANNILYVSPPVRLTDFIIGLLLYRLYRSPQLSPFLSFQRRSFITCIECIAIALVWGCLLIAPDIPVKFRTSLWFFPRQHFYHSLLFTSRSSRRKNSPMALPPLIANLGQPIVRTISHSPTHYLNHQPLSPSHCSALPHSLCHHPHHSSWRCQNSTSHDSPYKKKISDKF